MKIKIKITLYTQKLKLNSKSHFKPKKRKLNSKSHFKLKKRKLNSVTFCKLLRNSFSHAQQLGEQLTKSGVKKRRVKKSIATTNKRNKLL